MPYINHILVFEFDGQAVDIRLIVVTGEIYVHMVMTGDEAEHGDILCHDCVLVDDLAVVCLQVHMDTQIVSVSLGAYILYSKNQIF